MSLRVVLIGEGRMGREVRAVAPEHDVEIVGVLGHDAPDTDDALLADADLAVEFTTPSAAVDNIGRCVRARCPVVVGTTGWYDRLDEVRARVAEADGMLLWAANFSAGQALLRALARVTGRRLGGLDGFGVQIVETHHAAKLDAPSGTALTLRDALAEGLGRSVDVTSVRVGHVPGTHDIVLDGPYEQVLLRHEARNRRVFADGALRAARWLHEKHRAGTTGVFTFDDVFEEELA